VAAGLQVSRKFSGKLAARLDLTRGGLRGNDARYPSPEWRQQRNFRFTTPVTEATVALVYYPIGTEHKINPYLFAGAGAALLRIRRDFSQYNATYFSRETISEGLAADLARPLPRVIPVVPVGVGVRYPLKDRLYLNTEVGYRVMSSDYLDGFSRAANPDLKDHYYSVSVGLNYAFGPRNAYDCPVIRY
jgi:opacity protein-like surface antigen